MAYVGTFSSPLRDVLPTQVDLPPGNGRGIHLFQVDRATGAMTPAGIHEMGTSPSCLALNAAGTRLYSANETDRVGDGKEGTVSAFAINRADGQLKLLNTVRFRRRRSHLCERPSVRTVRAGGQLFRRLRGGAADSARRPSGRRHGHQERCRHDRPDQGDQRSAGQLCLQRTRSDSRAHDSGRSSGRFVLHVDLGLDRIFVWKFDEQKGVLTPNDPPAVSLPPGDGPRHFIFTPTAVGSTPFRRKARPSSCSTTMPRRGGWPRGRRSPPCRPVSPAAISAPRSWFQPMAGSSMRATGCTTASGSSPSAQTAT